ncbi:hypothetical protein [Haloechinothrix halophila]|uniref:hypothetical protein n=1 Tax=Haloechinothrix halophila TaxID=1069073 RepID=UPI000401F14D|nr:hypothetical protein [Haloechinothrix halophila]
MTIERPSPVPREEKASGTQDTATGVQDTASGVQDTASGVQDTASGTQDTATGVQDTARRGRGLVLVLALLAVVSLGAAGTFGVLWWSERGQDTQRGEVLALAERIAVDVTTYDYRKIEQNFDRVVSQSTEKWAEVYRDERSEQLAEVIVDGKATSEGTVRDAGIAELTEDKAVVIAFVDQTITNVHTPQPRIDRNRMRLVLRKVDDEWLLDRYDLA